MAEAALAVKDLCDTLLLLGGGSVASTRAVDSAAVKDRTTSRILSLEASSRASRFATDLELASLLQAAMDAYALKVQAASPPIAPNYPPLWIKKRLMQSVARLQETTSGGGRETSGGASSYAAVSAAPGDTGSSVSPISRSAAADFSAVKSWWQTAADGIRLWQSLRRATFTLYE